MKFTDIQKLVTGLNCRSLALLFLVFFGSVGASFSADRSRDCLRGVMLPVVPVERDFKDLNTWGVTLVRYQMQGEKWCVHPEGAEKDELEAFDAWVDKRVSYLERNLLGWARKYGMKICVDMHDSPGGRKDSGDVRMYGNPRYVERYVQSWKRIAQRLKGNQDVIYGYDLFNEPVQYSSPTEGCDWWTVQFRAAEAVRSLDKITPIVAEAADWTDCAAFKKMRPIPLTNVIYEVHLYTPTAFTHQNVHADKKGKAAYPGVSPDGKEIWDKEYLRKAIEPLLDFQKKHNAKIYVGEFSAVAWAEGAGEWLEDAISLFEENSWDWTYHCFREWPGWSVEHEGADAEHMSPSASNSRKTVLLKGLRGLGRAKDR